jgi:hypothetical protein
MTHDRNTEIVGGRKYLPAPKKCHWVVKKNKGTADFALGFSALHSLILAHQLYARNGGRGIGQSTVVVVKVKLRSKIPLIHGLNKGETMSALFQKPVFSFTINFL